MSAQARVPAAGWIASMGRFTITDDERRGVDALLSVFGAVDAHELVYLSTPITGGRRQYELMARLACTAEDLRTRYRERYESEVVRANARDAEQLVSAIRSAQPGRTVVNSTMLHVAGASQNFYNFLWSQLIVSRVTDVVLAPGWAFSTGARTEAVVAVSAGLRVRESCGDVVDIDTVERRLDEALAHLTGLGFERSSVLEGLRIRVPSLAD